MSFRIRTFGTFKVENRIRKRNVSFARRECNSLI